MKKTSIINATLLVLLLLLVRLSAEAQYNFSTNYLKIHLDGKGFITSMKNITVRPGREYSSSDKPSPLLCLYDSKKKVYYEPHRASYNSAGKIITLSFRNGSVAKVSLVPHQKYLKLTLQSLFPRNGVDDIQWGPYRTNINNLFGEVIGVARDTSDANNYAIGVLALNDITTGGTSNLEGDAAPFQYVIHSPDKVRFPLPSNLHEGQVFPIGGDGISDVAFYSHHEEYYRILYGNAASIDDQGGIFLTYHARDRRTKKNISFSLIPLMAANIPNHQEVQPLPGVDFTGSSIAVWGSPDSTALMDVIQNIVLSEKLPYPKVNGKWIKDPARYIPDVTTSGNLSDSTIAYVSKLGFKAIEANDLPYFKVDRGNRGFIDGRNFEKKPFHFTSGDKSHKEFTDLSNPLGILLGRHTIATSLAQGTKDASPIPGDSLCYQQKRILTKGVGAADTVIEVNDPTYLNEIASWEGHCADLNMIKIGKELIHYIGVSTTKPYTLQKVKRGYWGTKAASHRANDTIYKLQVTINYGYDGLIPDIYLQDKIAEYYADVSHINGIGFMDLDGQEFLFNTGHGYYGVKRFFRKMFDRAAVLQIPYLRVSGATLSEGSWHYQSVWNVGGGTNMYDLKTRQWGSTTSEGKDLRNVAFANYFPASFGGNFPIGSASTVEQYEHIEAISVGVGATYIMELNQKSVESCPQKDAIFKTIRTWEDARAANAFPRDVKKRLADSSKNWTLEKGDNNDSWKLYEKTNGLKTNPITLTRAKGY
ncbi:hypothetical protein [Mucilaginibacter sp. BT774]|uniref:hypothetical protein n=1 Tax=Mucilaginibacter sp. BT774 TaxID=3062276 RepID=UPI0026768C9F|nr:hypothetical protein [Mucilaginibacter sp. BT774]MDO3627515.1 hypothetical protein [Mucilaginibacter sp. BT774]